MPDLTNIHLWDPTANKWVKAPAHVTDKRMDAVGQVYEGACKLHWILANPGAGLSLFELTDDTDGSGDLKLDHFDTSRDGHVLSFCPACRFGTGIWLKTFTNLTSLTFGYTPE